MLESQASEFVRSASVERVLGVLKHVARSQIPGHRKLVEIAYENVEKTRWIEEGRYFGGKLRPK